MTKIINLSNSINKDVEYLKQLKRTIDKLDNFDDDLGTLAMELAVLGKWKKWADNLEPGHVATVDHETLSDTGDTNIDLIIKLRNLICDTSEKLRKNNLLPNTMHNIYLTSSDNNARYSLGHITQNNLIIIGVNPSKATDTDPDLTVSKIKQFAKMNNSDGWIVFNLYPQRATSPTDIDKELNIEYHQQNLNRIESIFSKMNHKPIIWAAWGNLISTRPYFKKCLTDIHNLIKRYEPTWVHFDKLTAGGHPKHPSRLPYNVDKFNFDIENYITHLK